MATIYAGNVAEYQAFVLGSTSGNPYIVIKGSFGDAYLSFYPDGSGGGPTNTSITPSGGRRFWVAFRQFQWAHAIDILRNEQPVTFWFYDDVTSRGSLISRLDWEANPQAFSSAQLAEMMTLSQG